jgi:hypothetical protein
MNGDNAEVYVDAMQANPSIVGCDELKTELFFLKHPYTYYGDSSTTTADSTANAGEYGQWV